MSSNMKRRLERIVEAISGRNPLTDWEKALFALARDYIATRALPS
jgi:hypothetical protein